MAFVSRLTNPRTLSAVLHDLIASCAAWFFAFQLRFNFQVPDVFSDTAIETAFWLVPLQFFFFINFGLYQGIWRFASLPDLKRILLAVGVSALSAVVLIYMFQPRGIVPRSVLVLDPILLIAIMGGSRFLYRYWKEHRLYGAAETKGRPVLILGAGDLAINLLKDLTRSDEWRVVGLLDDDLGIQGRQILGVKVLGRYSELGHYVHMLNVEHVILALPAVASNMRRSVVEMANQQGLTVLTVPRVEDMISGKVSVSQIRGVEVEDLLGRDPVKLDGAGIHDLIEGQTVMVSGAGGSIGSELCRQIARYQPDTLVCFDISEFALYRIEQEFAGAFPETEIVYVVGDVKNEKRVKSLMQQFKPAVVFHAAAYKHVPLMEKYNVSEALANNVLGTYTVAKAAKEAKVEKFVLVSTDKAVNPTNVMGASKRLAEMVCQGLQDPNGTRFVIVRFGNVLGSSGSVIPKFREQIAKGGPITVTHPEITRYFMSIPEASQLVMQAGLMGSGGEIFVLDMGESVRIADLARDMIKLSGLSEDEIEIIYTGLRPGEKLYEELLADDERTLPTPHEKLRIAVARSADKAWVKALLKWIEQTVNADEVLIKQELKMWVEEYKQEEAKASSESYTAVLPSSTIH